MTDQNQTQDPQAQNDQNVDQNTNQDSGVFGGSDDIFENNDILEPIGDFDKDENIEDMDIQEIEPEIVEDIPEIKSDVEEKVEDNSTDIKHEGEEMEDFFDPFDDATLEDLDVEDMDIQEEPTLDTKEKVEEIKTTEVKTETKEVEIKDEVKDINETIAKIEKNAQEVRAKAEQKEKEITRKEEIKVETKATEEVEKKEEVKKEIEPIVENNKEDEIIEKKETNPAKSDLQNKFDELLGEATKVYELLGEKNTFEGFDLVGGNDDRLKTTYNIILSGDDKKDIEIKKIELNKSDNSIQEYNLEFTLDNSSINIKIDGELLYDEIDDLQENTNKKMQVMEKLNKFIFLISEEFKKLEKEKIKKEKRNILKGIFRNFVL